MATHSKILAWEIPWTEEAVRLQSVESQRVRQDWETKQQQHDKVTWCWQHFWFFFFFFGLYILVTLPSPGSLHPFQPFLWVFLLLTTYRRASLVPQMVMNIPAIQETQVRSLGQEDPLEKEIATHSNILAWRIPWREKHGWAMNTFQHTKYNFLSNSISCQQSFTLIGTNSVSSDVSVPLSLWMLPFLTYPYLYSISHYCWLLYSPISGSLLSKTRLLTFWAWQSWTFIVLSSNTWRFHLWEWNFSKERNMKTLELHHLYVHSFTWTCISVGMERIFRKAIQP